MELLEKAKKFQEHLVLRLPSPPSAMAIDVVANPVVREAQVLEILSYLTALVLEGSGIPIVEKILVREKSKLLSGKTLGWEALIPSYSAEATAQAFSWVTAALNRGVVESARWPFSKTALKELDDILDQIGQFAPSGTNNRDFIREAFNLRIPFLKLPRGVYLYGWGSRSKLFKSSLTEETGAIGSEIAQDKLHTNAFLQAAGLPVAEQKFTPTLKQALKAAEKMGYPVVVKAVDVDQGKGVEAGIGDAKDLKRAFYKVRQLHRPIVIEKYVAGEDIRVNVLDGVAKGVTHRIPASVTGDGQRTLSELIDVANSDPRRSDRRFSVMRPIVFNAEAERLAREQNLTQSEVVPKNQVVQLKRTANVSTGGVTIAVKEIVHPDNVILAERAAKSLRLDFAGVDLIVPDITKSWRAQGGIVCEVNPMPQIGLTYPDIFKQIFEAKIPGGGRIPVHYVLSSGNAMLTLLIERSKDQSEGKNVAVVHDNSVIIDGHFLQRSEDSLKAVQSVIMNNTVDEIFIVADGKEFGRRGAALDFADSLFVVDWNLDSASANSILRTLEPHVTGTVAVRADDPKASLCEAIFGKDRVTHRCLTV